MTHHTAGSLPGAEVGSVTGGSGAVCELAPPCCAAALDANAITPAAAANRKQLLMTENALIDFAQMRGFFAAAEKGGFIGCTPAVGGQLVKRAVYIKASRAVPFRMAARRRSKAAPAVHPSWSERVELISLPADGIGLPFEPNENFGTFSIGQHTDRQIGLSAWQDITPRRKLQRKGHWGIPVV
jgi:hypothetical protein